MIDKGRILPLRVLLRPIKEEEKTSSGLIYKPIDVIKKKTFAGEVVVVGDGVYLETPMKDIVHINDKILHSPHSYTAVEVDNETLHLINIQDALFIWRD